MNKKRLFYLDNLKVCLTVLVIFHHAGQAYGDGGGWAYTPSNPAEVMPWIWHFFSVNAAFFMGLFFLISGYFVPTSYDKQGASVFVQKKLIRLGIPLLVMGGLLSVLSGKLEIGHMWYIESLLVFCLLYALIRQFCKPINGECPSRPTIISLLIFGGIMGIGSYLIRLVSPQDHWIWPFGIIPLPMEPAHYLQYVMMFVIGVLARRFNWLVKMSNTTGVLSLAIGCLLALGIYLRDGGEWNAFVAQWFGIYESLLCVFISFGLLWLFREYGNCRSSKSHPCLHKDGRVATVEDGVNWNNKFWKWCASQAYGAYIFHLLLMLVLQHAVDGIWMGAFGKFMFIGVVITIASFGFTWLLRLIPGVKKVL